MSQRHPKNKAKAHRQASPPLSRTRRRIFALLTLSFPFVFLFLVEAGLRLFHYGPNLELFVTEQVGTKTYHLMNPDVKERYFSQVAFSPNTSRDYFLVPKPEGVHRIFCLGGSTTVGFPYGYSGSFSTFLRQRLQKMFPTKQIEVINLGMTATNSYTVNDIASELLKYEPDLFIVYDGHNEFYGALGIASQESLGGSQRVGKLYLRLVHLRLFHLVRNAVRAVGEVFSSSQATSETGTMMERLAMGQYVPYNSSKYQQCLSVFRANLEDLRDFCSSNEIAVLLGTQVSNLRDQPPFISNFSKGMSQSAQEEFEARFAQGREHFASGEFEVALRHFQTASTIDDLRADAHYWIALCLDTLGQKREARQEFIKARDYDQLRFRASTDFNDAILASADDRTAFVTDVEHYLASQSPDLLVGRELVLEHLHPNLRGYFLIAKSYVESMKKHGLLASKEEWQRLDEPDDTQLWSDRSVTRLDERAAARRIETLTAGWPYRSESMPVPDIPRSDTLGQIMERLVRGESTWEEAHVRAAEYYHEKGDLENARSEYRAILDQLQYSVSARLRLAQLYLLERQFELAGPLLTRSLEIEKTFYAYRSLGMIALNRSKPEEALNWLEQAYRLAAQADERIDAGYMLALAYAETHQSHEAISTLEQILFLNPRFKPASDLLEKIRGTSR